VDKVFKEKVAVTDRFLDYAGNMPVAEITPKVVQGFLLSEASQRSNNAVNKDRKNLSALFNWGVRVLGLANNPVARIGKLPHDKAPQYTPSTEEIERILAVATQEERVVLACFLYTAARRGEIFRLTWEDVDFERREIRLGTRKTKDGSMDYEWLPINQALYDELLWWRQNHEGTGYIFTSRLGKPFSRNADFMARLCRRANTKKFGFHALRRYAASVLADTPGIGIKRIQRVLRHKSAATTEHYIYSINRDLRDTMEVLGEITPPINPTQNTTS